MTGLRRSFGRGIASVLLLLGLVHAPATAQSSASYRLAEATVDDGGNPGNGGKPTAPHFHVSLDAVGDSLVRAGLASASFHMDAGFVGRYPPPGEVPGLQFTASSILQWSPEISASEYETYRGLITSLPGSYGGCFAGGLTSVSASDGSSPPLGQGYFYLVTARDRLGEEGPKGYRSGGADEGNPSPCP